MFRMPMVRQTTFFITMRGGDYCVGEEIFYLYFPAKNTI